VFAEDREIIRSACALDKLKLGFVCVGIFLEIIKSDDMMKKVYASKLNSKKVCMTSRIIS
jgi:hypothetical protein